MDTTPIAHTRALHRMLLQSLLPARPARLVPGHAAPGPLPPDAAETLPMLYRSEGFAEDLLDSHPGAG